ncbi:hypothetical protein R3W88_008281 [Solanum pinnatisectum]|uniref:Uncharacterized protein n=1 Tax=Solanum pinnatisectum TaxID=50273 RepID=A0AAV9M7H9_9SOLN|nr:hypothetical protein R3W88_008281 [Solanum pinnatisectum]
MTWVFWNVRGGNKWYKRKELKNYIKSKHIKLAGLVETRVKTHKASQVIQHIVPGWSFLNNYQDAINGRIVWIIWDSNLLDVIAVRSTTRFIHCQVKNKRDKMECMLFRNPVSFAETKDFNECIQEANLTELPWKGDYYTWSNKQQGNDRIYRRIDKLLGNGEWMSKWGTEYDIISLPFRFFNIWASHNKFDSIVAKGWKKGRTGDHMRQVLSNLKSLKPDFRKLNKEDFHHITQKIETCRCTFHKEILLNLEKWDLIEESVMKQKARVDWIKLGDSNTKYFSSVKEYRPIACCTVL